MGREWERESTVKGVEVPRLCVSHVASIITITTITRTIDGSCCSISINRRGHPTSYDVLLRRQSA